MPASRCPRCSAENRDIAVSCRLCGTRLKPPGAAAAPPPPVAVARRRSALALAPGVPASKPARVALPADLEALPAGLALGGFLSLLGAFLPLVSVASFSFNLIGGGERPALVWLAPLGSLALIAIGLLNASARLPARPLLMGLAVALASPGLFLPWAAGRLLAKAIPGEAYEPGAGLVLLVLGNLIALVVAFIVLSQVREQSRARETH